VRAQVHGDSLDLPSSFLAGHTGADAGPTALTVLYNDGSGDKLATSLSSEAGGALSIHPSSGPSSRTDRIANPRPALRIDQAFYGPVPGERTGWLMALCLALFIASFSVGPGVVVWLALSELMPTRIRSGGMGIALLINQGVSTLIAGVFLPVVGAFGYQAMFLFWTGCTVIYFITAVFFLPETKGKTLEEIELQF
jgi:SP family myo-inositol transporter-like MFS transporter 13